MQLKVSNIFSELLVAENTYFATEKQRRAAQTNLALSEESLAEYRKLWVSVRL